MLDLQAIESYVQKWYDGQVSDQIFATSVAAVYLPQLVAEVKLLRGGLPTRPLSASQARVLFFVADFIDVHGYAPSFEEIAASFGYSSLATVHEHLSNIERKGWISRQYNESRGITVLHRPVRREGGE